MTFLALYNHRSLIIAHEICDKFVKLKREKKNLFFEMTEQDRERIICIHPYC